MKIKTSITISEDLLATIDEMAADYKNRSDFIEIMLRKIVAQMIRAEQDARDIEIYNKHLDELNAEAEDVLQYQVIP